MAYQYRITVNGAQGNITNIYPKEQWEKIASVCDTGRIKYAFFEKRLVTKYEDGDNLLYPGIKLNNFYVSLWNVIAVFGEQNNAI